MNLTARLRRPWVVRVLVGVVTLALAAIVAHGVWPSQVEALRVVPQSGPMEAALGVRFSRVAVVGDGGLVTLSYVVLDTEKATRFLADVKQPPVLASESRAKGTSRVSMMRASHNLRAGSAYYLVYQNTAEALRPGERVTISYAGLSLEHVPVL